MSLSYWGRQVVGLAAWSFRSVARRHVYSNKQVRCASTGVKSLSKLVVSRMMGPDDTQMFGVVHGGTIMQLIEEAGTILSTQYCNRIGTSLESGDGELPAEVITVSGCVEKVDFVRPMFIGNLAEVHAEIGYSSPHSVQVLAQVYARDIAKASRKLAAQAKLWYVPLTKSGGGGKPRVMEVPARTYSRGDPRIREEGRISYERLQVIRKNMKGNRDVADNVQPAPQVAAAEPGTVAFSTVTMSNAIHPSSCWAGERYIRGGVVMKWMDECASLAATAHTALYCFTASVDTIMFLRKATVGGVLVVTSKPLFVGQKSIEMHISVDELQLVIGKGIKRQKSVDAIFTFVSLDEKAKPRDLPPLKLVTGEEKLLFEQRKQLYEQRKTNKP